MKFSLLFKIPDDAVRSDIIYDLSLDRTVNAFAPDKRHADYFLDLLSKPLRSTDNIAFRQQIYCDFESNPQLFDELKLLFTRYDRIKSDWHEMKLGSAPQGSSANPEALLEHTYSSLKITSMFPSTIANFFCSIGDTLSKYEIKSEGLCSIRDWCSEMRKNEALDEIVSIAQLFRYHSPEHYDFEMLVEIDNTFRVINCGLTAITEHSQKKDKNAFIKLFKKKELQLGSVSILQDGDSLENDCSSDSIFLLCQSLSQIDQALTRITNEIYEAFFGLSREMMFYETALACFEMVNDAGIPHCIPEMLRCEADTLNAHELYDLHLCSIGKNKDSIVPNDIEISESDGGMLVKGATDSGKTVFLRSVGSALIFAQAGLPVPCSDACFSIRHAFFSHFSSAEEEFKPGSTAGRFEGEAQQIAEIVDSLVPYSFVMLNETFQTTSYGEGTEGICNIIRILPYIKTKYIFVTHLTGLFDIMKNDSVVLARTDTEKKYKVIPINKQQ